MLESSLCLQTGQRVPLRVGTVAPEDMAVVDELLGLPTEPFVHPTYKTTMAGAVPQLTHSLKGAWFQPFS
jgi:hypothetical protein